MTAMASLEPMFSIVFEDLPDGICASDSEGNILYMNPAAERLLDVKFAQAKGLSLCGLLCGQLSTPGSKECASQCPLRDPNSADKAVTFAGRHNHRLSYQWQNFGLKRVEKWKNLRVRCLRMPTTWLDSAKPEKHFTIIEDISAERDLERRKEDWRSMVAHDLRSPLTNIYGVLKTLEEIPEGEPLDGRIKNLIQISLRGCRRMTELLDLFLEVTQFEVGAVPVKLEDISVQDTVKQCVEEQSAFALSRKIEVGTAMPEALTARADAGLLIRVVQNLLNNALKFTPEGGRVSISSTADSDAVYLRVKDTGLGISPEDIPFIFDRFHQARARREGKIQGNGLGLAFCREALKAMGGEIDVESTPGKGSEFIVRLKPGTAMSKAK